MKTPRYKIVATFGTALRALSMKQIAAITHLDEEIVEAELPCMYDAGAIYREGAAPPYGYWRAGTVLDDDLPF